MSSSQEILVKALSGQKLTPVEKATLFVYGLEMQGLSKEDQLKEVQTTLEAMALATAYIKSGK